MCLQLATKQAHEVIASILYPAEILPTCQNGASELVWTEIMHTVCTSLWDEMGMGSNGTSLTGEGWKVEHLSSLPLPLPSKIPSLEGTSDHSLLSQSEFRLTVGWARVSEKHPRGSGCPCD